MNRDRKHPSFQALVDKVYTIITNPELETIQPPATTSVQPATPPAKYQSLPAVRIGSIAGLLELLEDRQEKDLYRLAQELQLEVDEILPVVYPV